MKLTKHEESAFISVGEPMNEPNYMEALQALRKTLSPEQDALFLRFLDAFCETLRYERRWYFQKGYRTAKKETP
jgi:hypothetical protein